MFCLVLNFSIMQVDHFTNENEKNMSECGESNK